MTLTTAKPTDKKSTVLAAIKSIYRETRLPMNLRAIAERTGLAYSTTHTYVQVLQAEGKVARNGSCSIRPARRVK